MRHFLSPEVGALNAKLIPIDVGIVDEFTDPSRLAGRMVSVNAGQNLWNSDIEWISADDEIAFRVFESAFERLGIPEQAAQYLDIDREVRLFGGFVIVRTYCTAPYFHTDWTKLNNEAFTVLTPITPNADQFGLLYQKVNGSIGEYAYRRGEAILFGDGFYHSTKPGRSDDPVMLLCFQFGTDKMEHWPAINGQLNTQATMLRQPDGLFLRTGGKASRQVN